MPQAVTVGLGVELELALTLAHALGDALVLTEALSVAAALRDCFSEAVTLRTLEETLGDGELLGDPEALLQPLLLRLTLTVAQPEEVEVALPVVDAVLEVLTHRLPEAVEDMLEQAELEKQEVLLMEYVALVLVEAWAVALPLGVATVLLLPLPEMLFVSVLLPLAVAQPLAVGVAVRHWEAQAEEVLEGEALLQGDG